MGADKEITVEIFDQYEKGTHYKASLGALGLFEQSDVNEHFFIGDQWYNADCKSLRPLVRHNVIQRIGNYKMAIINAAPVTVNFSAEGVPNTVGLQENEAQIRDAMAAGAFPGFDTLTPGTEEINTMTSALSDYYKSTSERLKANELMEKALRNAYIAGTGILYTYWDDRIKTGLYADESRTMPQNGDIACEVLHVENVIFGNPNIDDVQSQPYIIIAQRKSVEELKREARKNQRPREDIDAICPDRDSGYTIGIREPDDSKNATVLTKIYKDYNEDGTEYTVKAVRVVKGAVIRGEWDMKIRVYPLSIFSWEPRKNSIYGESEITYLVPNQIAINRMLTASVWAIMMMGMPITVINKAMFPDQVLTNNPGQILEYAGDPAQMGASIDFKSPGNFSAQFDNMINSLITNTLTQAGANDAALGDIRPDNMSAIIAVREAATMPMQLFKNRFYQFVEDTARIWAEFWIMMYGDRGIKIDDDNGVWYMPFDGKRYQDLVLSTKVDVGASTLWSEAQSIQTLDNLFGSQIINAMQYLERLPKGVIPNLNGLIKEMKKADEEARQMAQQATAAQQGPAPSVEQILGELDPQAREAFINMPKDLQLQILQSAMEGPENDGTGSI